MLRSYGKWLGNDFCQHWEEGTEVFMHRHPQQLQDCPPVRAVLLTNTVLVTVVVKESHLCKEILNLAVENQDSVY